MLRLAAGSHSLALPRCARRRAAPRLLLATLLLLPGSGAWAQWISVAPADNADGAVHDSALARNASGASLRIYLGADNRLAGEFKLAAGLISLDPATCPTLQIDENQPENLNAPEHDCEVSGDLARFTLAPIEAGQVDSKTFLELMNGGRLQVRYRLLGAGYGQQSFSLKGSKQVLKATLDHGTLVVGD